MAILRQVRIRQLEKQLYLGDAWRGSGCVFTSQDGSPISGERLSKDFMKIRRSVELPYLTLHGLRHTAVSLMIAGGVHAKAIADFVGHSSISTTMDVYGHLIERGGRGDRQTPDRGRVDIGSAHYLPTNGVVPDGSGRDGRTLSAWRYRASWVGVLQSGIADTQLRNRGSQVRILAGVPA